MSLYVSTGDSLPIYILFRFESVQHSTGETSRREVEVDSMHPGVFIQLQHLLNDLHTKTKTHMEKKPNHGYTRKKLTFNITYAGMSTVCMWSTKKNE